MTISERHEGGPPRTRQDAFERLRSDGGRVTTARRAMVEWFYGRSRPITAEDLGAEFPEVDQATIYRTLASLERAGIIEHTHLGHGPATYRRAGQSTVPVTCERCGASIFVERTELDLLAERLRSTDGFELALHHFALTGTCRSCGAGAATRR